jgi:hypothetical protein
MSTTKQPPPTATAAPGAGGIAGGGAAVAATTPAPPPPAPPSPLLPPPDGRCLLLELPSDLLSAHIVARLAPRHVAALRSTCRQLAQLGGLSARRLA